MHRDISRQTSVARQQQLAQSKPSRSGGPCFFFFQSIIRLCGSFTPSLAHSLRCSEALS